MTPEHAIELLPAIPGHEHVIDAKGNLICGCRWPEDLQERLREALFPRVSVR